MSFLASPIKTTCTHILALLPEKAEVVVAKDEKWTLQNYYREKPEQLLKNHLGKGGSA